MARKKYLVKATAYDKRGRVISQGVNNYNKTHPIMLHFAEKVKLNEKIYLHAEVQALLRAGDKQVHSLFIERYNADGTPALAKPCPVCAAAIKAYGVKQIFYTDLVKEKIND